MAAKKAAPKKAAGKTTMKAPGKAPISFQKGGLHSSLGVPQGQPIPAAKMASALAGKEGPKAAAQARFAVNVLGAGKGGSKKPAAKKPAAKKKG